MSIILSGQALSKSYHARELFRGLSLGIFENDRLGIIGPNGAGKSTLLRLLAGIEEPDEGSLSLRRMAKVAYVPQVAAFTSGEGVREVLRRAAIAGGGDPDGIDVVVDTLLGQVGFSDLGQRVETLSGGWKKRLTIACGLIQRPDLLLLDEPTNHLDLEGILWLEDLLNKAAFAWVMVSHDRTFLEKTARRIAEVNPLYENGIFLAEGAYESFLAKRDQYWETQARHQQSLQSKVRRETEWLSRGPKARTTKARYRVEEAHAMISELKELRSRGQTREVGIEFAASGRKTKQLVVLDGIEVERGGRRLATGLDLILTPGMGLGIMGGNGTGKTTLLRTIAGLLPPRTGEVRQADNLKVVYFDQNRESLDPSQTLKRALAESGDSVIYQGRSIHVASWARRFNFRPEQLDLLVGDLSGGEQARLLIARLMLAPADVLLLDEPTNDLDIPTLEILEESLIEFTGALVLVSHDRYLLGRVANLFLGLDGLGGSILYGSYEQWEDALRRGRKEVSRSRANAVREPATEGQSGAERSTRKRLSYLDQREYDMMEQKIVEAEAALESARILAENPEIATQPVKLQQAYRQLEEAQQEVERLYGRWAELEAKLES